MKIMVGIDQGRSRLGRMTLRGADGKVSGPFDACGTADAATSLLAGNRTGDPLRPGGSVPFGQYQLQEVREAQPEMKRDWGANMLIFQPRSGQAREAESLGRLVLVLHGGRPGDDGGLRTTGIGLRVAEETLEQVVAAANRGETVDLEIGEVPLSIWDRLLFWRRRPSRAFADSDLRTDDDWRWSRNSSDGSSSEPETSFGGRGGSFGGAGASGSWDAPSGTGAVAAAAGIAALGAGVIAASELGFGNAPGGSGSESGSADSGSTSSAEDAGSSPSSDSGDLSGFDSGDSSSSDSGDSSGSDSGDSSTSTSY